MTLVVRRFTPFLTFLFATGLSATTTQYTTRSTFLSTLGTSTNIDFNSYGTFADFSTAAGLTDSGVQFIGTLGNGSNYLVVDGASTYEFNGTPSLGLPYGTYNNTIPLDAVLTINMPSNIDALGFNYAGAGISDLPITWQIVLSNGSTLSGSEGTRLTADFIGFVSDSPISSLTLTTNGSVNHLRQLLIDDFVFGNPTPEPSTAILSVSSILVGLLLRKRARNLRA